MKNNKFNFFLFFFILCCLTSPAITLASQSNDQLILNYSEELSGNINYYLKYFIDETKSQSLNEIKSKIKEFNSLDVQNIALGVEEKTTWLRLLVNNDTTKEQKLYLSFTPSYMGVIELYDPKIDLLNPVTATGTLVKSEFGDSSWELAIGQKIPQGQKAFWIKIKSIGTAISVKAFSEKQFLHEKIKNEIIFFIIFGALCILCLYHLFIFITSRHRIYIYYVFYSFFMIGALFTLTGFNRYFFPVSILGFPIGYLGSLLFANLLFIAVCGLSYELLELGQKSIKLRMPFFLVSVLALLSILFLIFSQSYLSIPFTRILGLIFVISCLTIGIIDVLRGNRIAQFYLISWAPILLATTLIVLVLSGKMASTWFTDWVLAFGSVIESMFLAMAVGTRLERIAKEKIKEQELRIQAFEQLEENFIKLKQRDEVIRSFVNPTILSEVALKREPLKYEPKYLQKAILFSDLRSYTSMTEKCTPIEAYELLNIFFEAMNSEIFSHGGEVDKLIGDAVMATFWDAQSCLNAVTNFRIKILAINQNRIKNGQIPIRVGCGITYGQVLSANFGSIHKLDRTIVGDVVNLASRIEGLTKDYKTDIICSEAFVSQLTDVDIVDIRLLDRVNVKGKAEAVKIYDVFTHCEQYIKDFKRMTKNSLKKMFAYRCNLENEKAMQILKLLIEQCPIHESPENLKNEMLDPTLIMLEQKWSQ